MADVMYTKCKASEVKADECAEPKNNACMDCVEGNLFGEKIYCSIDGCFHPLHDSLVCESFVPKGGAKK